MSQCPPHSSLPDGFDPRALRPAETFSLTVLRLWAAPYRQPNQSHRDWREGFAAAGAEEAQDPFDTFMRFVVSHAVRALDVRCLGCRNLGEDEIAFLRLTGLSQRHRWDEAEALLADWFRPDAARTALAPAMLFATAIAAAGLRLPLRADDGSVAGPLLPHRHASFESLRVH